MQRHTDNTSQVAGSPALPTWLIWSVGAVCALPLLLHLIGVESASSAAGDATATVTHVLLDWTAVCAAIMTAALAFIHFRITRDVTTPVIGMALLSAGCMDAFHVLAAVRFIGEPAPDRLLPFTSTLSRLFPAIILVSGVALMLRRRQETFPGKRFVTYASVGFVLAATLTIQICTWIPRLPQTIFPDSFVTRPYDLIPLLLFLGAGIPLFTLFHRRHRSLFTHALLISLIPAISMGMYMAFGSSAQFDARFHAAHALKIVMYGVPLAGLLLEYNRSFDDRSRADQARRETEARFELAVRGTNDGVWDWDTQTNEVWYAPRFKELLGYREDEFPNRLESFNDHLHPDDYNETWHAIETHLRHSEPFDVESRLRTRDGQYRWFRARGIAVRNEAGEPVRMAGSIQDITDRRLAIDQLESLSKRLAQSNTEFAVDARIDPLTKVLNRRAWEEGVSIEDERSRRHDRPYVVIIMDIDHFKKFNDTAGHLAGDECLEQVSACIRNSCRMIDVVGRYGGEEFVVLLPETDPAGGEIVARRILETVRTTAIPHPGLGPNGLVTISLGVAAGPGPDGWKTVLDRADKALYRAKSDGRDRLVISTLDQAA